MKNFNEVEHQEEIRQSRVGGFGGSDAGLFLRIASNGVENLSITDRKRIAVAMGIDEMPNWGGNKYTEAGHAFEDYVDGLWSAVGVYTKREARLEATITNAFKTFAHADFVKTEGNETAVFECKFVQRKTPEVESEYKAQLQWYYLMGATTVSLVHGWGSVEPFNVEDLDFVQIEKDEEITQALQVGIEALAQAWHNGWIPEFGDIVNEFDAIPHDVMDCINNLRQIKTQIEELQSKEIELRDYITDYMVTDRHATLKGDTFIISNVAPKVGKSFDSKAFKKDYPELYEKYVKRREEKGYISVTFKDI